MDNIRKRKFRFNKEFYVDPVGLSGGLAVWWDDSVYMEVLFHSKNIIHVVVSMDSFVKPCFCSFVYGPPRAQDRGLFGIN